MGQKAARATGVWQGISPPLLTGGSSGAGRHGLSPSLQGGQALLATRGAMGEKTIKGQRNQDPSLLPGRSSSTNQTGHCRCRLSSSMHPGLATGGSLCSSSVLRSSSASQLHTTTLSSFSASLAAAAREGGHRQPPEALAPCCGTLGGLKLRAPLPQPGRFPPRSPSKGTSPFPRPLLSAPASLLLPSPAASRSQENSGPCSVGSAGDPSAAFLQRQHGPESRPKLHFRAVTERKQQRSSVKWN